MSRHITRPKKYRHILLSPSLDGHDDRYDEDDDDDKGDYEHEIKDLCDKNAQIVGFLLIIFRY